MMIGRLTAPVYQGFGRDARLVYRLTFSDGSSDEDRLVAVFFRPEDATDYVTLHNAAIGSMPDDGPENSG